MSRVEEAVEKLEAAIKRLDGVLPAGGAPGGKEVGGGEVDSLRAELEAVHRRNREVETVADQVAERLGQAVGRVTAILES